MTINVIYGFSYEILGTRSKESNNLISRLVPMHVYRRVEGTQNSFPPIKRKTVIIR